MKYPLEFYKTKVQNDTRILQAEILEDILKKHFNFDKIECIETGCSSGNYDDFGIYLSKLCELNSGKFITVDISEDNINKSKKLYSENVGEFDSEFHIMDSVDFLKKYEGSPNLVHLDSWDLDLLNPISSMLHCWLEFNEIKDKMPSGSICLIDDNYFKNTWVNFHEMVDGVMTDKIYKIDITYDIIGKGSLIYHWIMNTKTDWEIIGEHYTNGSNVKLIIKKK